jgi:hypothetical protein
MNLSGYLPVTKKHVQLKYLYCKTCHLLLKCADTLLTTTKAREFVQKKKGKGRNKYPPLSRDAKGAISI